MRKNLFELFQGLAGASAPQELKLVTSHIVGGTFEPPAVPAGFTDWQNIKGGGAQIYGASAAPKECYFASPSLEVGDVINSIDVYIFGYKFFFMEDENFIVNMFRVELLENKYTPELEIAVEVLAISNEVPNILLQGTDVIHLDVPIPHEVVAGDNYFVRITAHPEQGFCDCYIPSIVFNITRG